MTPTATNRPEPPPEPPVLAVYRLLCRAALYQAVAAVAGAFLHVHGVVRGLLALALSWWLVRAVRAALPAVPPAETPDPYRTIDLPPKEPRP